MYFYPAKKMFPMKSRVEFHSTSDPRLDGQKGWIVGHQDALIQDHYIVLLELSYSGQLAIQITEACLRYTDVVELSPSDYMELS